MASPLVLVIDDEKNLVNSLVYGLRGHGLKAEGALSGEAGLALAGRIEPDVVLVDLRLPDVDGLTLLDRLKHDAPETAVIMISAHGDTRAAVEAVKRGAEDFLTKPFDLEEVVHVIRRTTREERLDREVRFRRRQAVVGEGILGTSQAMTALREQVVRIAQSNARTVLLLGESGTGKALVARALHRYSAFADGPFVELNCATLPEALLEAELFGAEKGAYTGAHQRRIGLAQLADGGTLLLDEIGELPLHLQAKLLHFIETRRFRPVGAARERVAEARIIAATNRDIGEEARSGQFRADLYYRLNVVPLHLPRLAERGQDVIELAEHFARQSAEEENCETVSFDAECRTRFLEYPWPGNVRELKNLIERLTILYPGTRIGPALLPPEFHRSPEAEGSCIEARLAATERDILTRALVEAGGHKGRAAEALGISRHALKRRLKRVGMA